MSPARHAENVRLWCTYCGMTFTVPADLLTMVAIFCTCGISSSHPTQFDAGAR